MWCPTSAAGTTSVWAVAPAIWLPSSSHRNPSNPNPNAGCWPAHVENVAAWQVSDWPSCGGPGTTGAVTAAAGAPAPTWPTLLVVPSVNHRFPSLPVAMPMGPLFAVAVANSVMAWVTGLMSATCPVPPPSVNHMLPSGPGTITVGEVKPVPNSVTVLAAILTKPILLTPGALSVIQRLPFGPVAIALGWLEAVIGKSLVMPVLGSITPRRLFVPPASFSVNQMFPSGPTVIPNG